MDNNNILYIWNSNSREVQYVFNSSSNRAQILVFKGFRTKNFNRSDLNSQVHSWGDKNLIQELWRDH